MSCLSTSTGDSVPSHHTNFGAIQELKPYNIRSTQDRSAPLTLLCLWGYTHTHTSSSSEKSLRSPPTPTPTPCLLSWEHSHLGLQRTRPTFIRGRYVSAPGGPGHYCVSGTSPNEQKRRGEGGRRGRGEERGREGKDWEGHLRWGSSCYFEKRERDARETFANTLTLLPAPNLPSLRTHNQPPKGVHPTTGSFGDSRAQAGHRSQVWEPQLSLPPRSHTHPTERRICRETGSDSGNGSQWLVWHFRAPGKGNQARGNPQIPLSGRHPPLGPHIIWYPEPEMEDVHQNFADFLFGNYKRGVGR